MTPEEAPTLIAGNQPPRDPERFARAVVDWFYRVEQDDRVVYDEAKVIGGADTVEHVHELITLCGLTPANMINSDLDDGADDKSGVYTVAVYFRGDDGAWHYHGFWKGHTNTGNEACDEAIATIRDDRVEYWRAEIVEAPTPSPDDYNPEDVLDLLLLTDKDPDLATIAGWTPEERVRAYKWAVAEHLSASDNPDVRRLPEPDHVRLLPLQQVGSSN